MLEDIEYLRIEDGPTATAAAVATKARRALSCIVVG
jgi:hypothetical protein